MRSPHENRNLKAERNHTDKSLTQERKKADESFHNGRVDIDRTNLKGQIFSVERGETNSRLSEERSLTDREATRHQKQLKFEQQLHFTTKEALATRDEFLAIVAHDLRNPLGAILSSSELLLDEVEGMTTDDCKKLMELIKRNAEKALRLVGDLMDMERIAEHKLALQMKRHNLLDLLSNAVQNFRHEASLKKVGLNFRGPDRPVFLVCDEVRISQVITNLLDNALKFTPPNGTISLDVKQFEKEAYISIADTGPGLSTENQRRIFGRFEQIHNRDRQGLGLGLYISKMLILAHGGHIGVKSELGHGCAFYFSLPLAQASQ